MDLKHIKNNEPQAASEILSAFAENPKLPRRKVLSLLAAVVLTSCSSGKSEKNAKKTHNESNLAYPYSGSRFLTSIPQGKIINGVTIENIDTDLSLIDQFETKTAKKIGISQVYKGWGSEDTLNGTFIQTLAAKNIATIITWEPFDSRRDDKINQPEYSLRRLIDGTYDKYIINSAKEARKIKTEFILRVGAEFNTGGTSFSIGQNGNKIGEYGAFLSYVMKIFDQVGANNVIFAFNPNIPTNDSPSIKAEYPKYIPRNIRLIMALDGYNSIAYNGKSLSFKELFSQGYAELMQLNPSAPFLIPEFGCDDVDGIDKSGWILDAYEHAKQNFPNLFGLVYYDENYNGKFGLESSPKSLAAFTKAMQNPNILDTATV